MNRKQAYKKALKNRNRKIVSNYAKLNCVSSILPVMADYIYDLDLENSDLFKKVYDAIREVDESLTQRNENQTEEEYLSAMEQQVLIQRSFRENFFKQLFNNDEQ